MVRAVVVVQVVATELQPGNKVDSATASAKKADTSGSDYPSESALSAARLATIPIPALVL